MLKRIVDIFFTAKVEKATYVFRVRDWVPFRRLVARLLRLGIEETRLLIWRKEWRQIEIEIVD